MSRPTGSGARQRRSLTLAVAAALVALLAPPAFADGPNPVTASAAPAQKQPPRIDFTAPDPGLTTELYRGAGVCAGAPALDDTGIGDATAQTQLIDAAVPAEGDYCYSVH